MLMDSDDEFLYHTFIDTSDESSDDDSDIMVAAATLIHNFNQNAVPRHVGSVVGRAPALDRERENGHLQFWKDYFNPVKTTGFGLSSPFSYGPALVHTSAGRGEGI